MTWLLFDAGNSALKWALGEPDGSRLSTIGGTLSRSSDLPQVLTAELKRRVVSAVDAAFGCSVADRDVAQAVDAAARAACGVPVAWLESQADFATPELRLRNGYRNPLQLGADRWHALLAARAAYPERALVVVNAGTATTVDCVTASGDFVGGVIAPGVRLMLDSLARRTAQLPQADGEFVARPDNTDDAITTGVLECQLGLIERRVRRFAAEAGPVLLLLDGGNAPALQSRLAFDAGLVSVRRESNLVLRGVLIRARGQALATLR